jgi:hypothetical protein
MPSMWMLFRQISNLSFRSNLCQKLHFSLLFPDISGGRRFLNRKIYKINITDEILPEYSDGILIIPDSICCVTNATQIKLNIGLQYSSSKLKVNIKFFNHSLNRTPVSYSLFLVCLMKLLCSVECEITGFLWRVGWGKESKCSWSV